MTKFGEDVLVPIFGVFCAFALPVLAFVFFRIMAHRERMEMIRMGLAPTGRAAHFAQVRSQNVPTAPPVIDGSDEARVTLRKGITLTFIGFALTLGLSFIGWHDNEYGMSWHPGPWLLGGLVPLFVGLAQIAIAVLSGATLGTQRFGPSTAAPPPPPGTAPGDARGFEGSYTYRPGTTQELRPPRPPRSPDR